MQERLFDRLPVPYGIRLAVSVLPRPLHLQHTRVSARTMQQLSRFMTAAGNGAASQKLHQECMRHHAATASSAVATTEGLMGRMLSTNSGCLPCESIMRSRMR